MLELKGIVKDYIAGETVVHALKNVNLTFRKCEFVSILGPSGCGKTTMLNILGGLDQYTDGDLLINGKSTKHFRAADWDAYRNSCVGFVFQSYNLISHLSILANVELALTLSGVSRQERLRRATNALEKVGLGEVIHKRPNQLSGGQMQRVAIARAIVNDPEVILADEPTGALDSKTSLQIADLLKEIARDKLVVMVTHNDQLAEQYSTRIIKMVDGEIISDTEPFEAPEYVPTEAEIELETMLAGVPDPLREPGEEDKKYLKRVKKSENERARITAVQERKMYKQRKAALDKTSMGPVTALKLATQNLMTKKGRTIMVSIAASIGIIGVALVLAVSNGFTGYMHRLESDTLSGYPITVSQYTTDIEGLYASMGMQSEKIDLDKFPTDDKLNIYEQKQLLLHYNKITEDYVDYVKKMDQSAVNDISYSYGMNMNVLSKTDKNKYVKVNTASNNSITSMLGMSSGYWQELLPKKEFIKKQYDVISGDYPSLNRNPDGSFDIAVVVDQYNRISTKTMEQLGLTVQDIKNATLTELIGKEMRWIPNDEWYEKAEGKEYYQERSSEKYGSMYNKGVILKVSGVMRIKESAPISLYNTGVVYPNCLTDYVREDSKVSKIGIDQATKNINVLPDSITGDSFPFKQGATIPKIDNMQIGGISFGYEQIIEMLLQLVGAGSVPTGINIYPSSFESKDYIANYLDTYNEGKAEKEKVLYMDAASIMTSTMSMLINTISIVLVAFAAISLVVSSLMIAIITYTSVIERTKEIGILRSIGARKKDISRLFNAETTAIGFVAGLFGVLIAVLLSFPLNAVLVNLAGDMVVGTLVALSPVSAIVLIAISMLLTFISGVIPAGMASKKDPVKALRSE